MSRLLIVLLLALSTVQAQADYPLEIIELKSRQVDEMIPILRPFIDQDGSIAGMNQQLIIRTSEQNLAQIKEILQRLDQPPVRLMISVRQSAGSTLRERSAQADVNTMLGKNSKVIVGGSSNRSDLRLRLKSAKTRSDNDITHRIQVNEGHPAFIATGKSVPIEEQTSFITGDTLHRQTTTRYHDVSSGFYAVPRLNNDRDRVTVEIRPGMNRPGTQQGSYETQQADSVISGRLGEWLTLGGVSQRTTEQQDDLLRETRTASRDERTIELRVELIAD